MMTLLSDVTSDVKTFSEVKICPERWRKIEFDIRRNSVKWSMTHMLRKHVNL